MTSSKPVIIIMGVSGSGKTTIGKRLSALTSIPFFDADDFHPASNVAKMSAGIPLSDKDRLPWLQTLSQNISKWKSQNGGILACSALKENYRTILSDNNIIHWVYLKADSKLLTTRLTKRQGHYMKSNLLRSQLETLEEPTYGLHIMSDQNIETILDQISQTFELAHD